MSHAHLPPGFYVDDTPVKNAWLINSSGSKEQYAVCIGKKIKAITFCVYSKQEFIDTNHERILTRIENVV